MDTPLARIPDTGGAVVEGEAVASVDAGAPTSVVEASGALVGEEAASVGVADTLVAGEAASEVEGAASVGDGAASVGDGVASLEEAASVGDGAASVEEAASVGDGAASVEGATGSTVDDAVSTVEDWLSTVDDCESLTGALLGAGAGSTDMDVPPVESVAEVGTVSPAVGEVVGICADPPSPTPPPGLSYASEQVLTSSTAGWPFTSVIGVNVITHVSVN